MKDFLPLKVFINLSYSIVNSALRISNAECGFNPGSVSINQRATSRYQNFNVSTIREKIMSNVKKTWPESSRPGSL